MLFFFFFYLIAALSASDFYAAGLFGGADGEKRAFLNASDCDAQRHMLEGARFEDIYEPGSVIRGNLRCVDGEIRPYFIKIPDDYDPEYPAGMIVYLHGGLSDKAASDTAERLTQGGLPLRVASETGYVLLLPAGDIKAAWWDYTGMTDVTALIKIMKTRFNIDDDRVHLMGYSDGGSGVYALSMFSAIGFGGSVVINGHPAVGGENGAVDLYPVNLSNRRLMIFMSGEDEMYPPDEMKRLLPVLTEAGAETEVVTLEGERHMVSDIGGIVKRSVEFIKDNPRPAASSPVIWEYGGAGTGGRRYRWLRIDGVGDGGPEKTYNKYFISRDKEGNVGLNRKMFSYNGPSGRVRGVIDGNTIDVTAENVTALTVYIDPLVLDISKEITIVINGKRMYHGVLPFSPAVSFETVRDYFDRKDIYSGKVHFDDIP